MNTDISWKSHFLKHWFAHVKTLVWCPMAGTFLHALWMDRENLSLCLKFQLRRQHCISRSIQWPWSKDIQLSFCSNGTRILLSLSWSAVNWVSETQADWLPQCEAAKRKSEPDRGKWKPPSVPYDPWEASGMIWVITCSCVQVVTLPDSPTPFILSLTWWPHPTRTISSSLSSPSYPPHLAIPRATLSLCFWFFFLPSQALVWPAIADYPGWTHVH